MTDHPEANALNVDLSIVVPAFNEEKNIATTLTSLLSIAETCPSIRVEIVVIDDGSRDGTALIAERFSKENSRVRFIKNPGNLGLGATIRVGIEQAHGRKLLIVPGDNDLPASALSLLIGHSVDADLVMCYFVNRELRGRVRNLLSTFFGLIYTTCFDIYPQYINGPCVYPVAALRGLELFSTRFSIVAEINVKLLRQGVSFLEVASYRQVGLAGSSSFSIRNLLETAEVFVRLCYEVHVRSRPRYAKRPVRVLKETP